MKAILKWSIFAVIGLFFSEAFAQQSLHLQSIRSRTHAMVVKVGLVPLGRLDTTAELNLVFGLAFQNEPALNNLIREVYDPASLVRPTLVYFWRF